MKWFKHSALAAQDAKLKKLRIRYGMQGYGLYWYCLELIASEVDSNKLTFELEHDSEILAHDTGINHKVVEEMMFYMVELGLFENIDGVITCFALAKRADEYLVKSLKREGKIKELENVRTMSGHSLDKVRPEESRGEEIKEDKKNKKNTSVSQANPDTYDWDLVLQSWNAMAERNGLPAMRALGDERKKAAKESFARLNKLRKQSGKDALSFTDFIEGYLSNVEYALTPFHKGENNRGWRCDFKYAFDKKVTESLITEGELKR